MPKRKPETLALFVALIGTLTVLAVFLADLLLARHRDLEAGERRIQHFGIMMSEHTARSFEAVDVLLREMSTDLTRNRNQWERWSSSQGWEYVAQRHSRAMPQLRDLIIFDSVGNQRFISSYFPTPRINVHDRPYFRALSEGAESTTWGPYVGRNSGRYTYALARRINDEAGSLNGVVFAAIEPDYLQDFCWSNRLSDDFEAVLINAEGRIIASCRPADLSAQSPVIGGVASEVLFGGKLRGILPESGLANGNDLLISVSPVPGFSDLRILTAIPEKTLLANWYSRLIELSTLAALVTAVLLVGGLLVRRQVREMAELTAELASGHEQLETRVSAATLELAGQKDLAERSNRAKSRFLAAASHDLRQPLHALSLFVADLQRQVRDGHTEDLPRLAEQIATSTAMLGELLDSLLDISRLDVVGIKPDIRAFPLMPLFARLADASRREALDRKLTLRFRPTSLWVDSDPLMVERILTNLISNALRYTPGGGRVLLAARRRNGGVRIEIRDSGMGIAQEHQAAIFAEFYQIGNTAREHNKGLGLGLSIVDRLARALKIEISLNSRIGEGTTFSLQLSSAQPHTDASRTALPVASGRLHCIGCSEALQECIRLAEHWDYAVSHDDGAGNEILPPQSLILCDPEFADAVAHELGAGKPLIVLSDGEQQQIPAEAHRLLLPVRPARLRALLAQLQKTLSKSTP